MVLYRNFRSFAVLGLLGFWIKQLKIKFIATLLSAAKFFCWLGGGGGPRSFRVSVGTEIITCFPLDSKGFFDEVAYAEP